MYLGIDWVYILSAILVLNVLCFVWLRVSRGSRTAVVVLGDIGLSPRMQYHALSLAKQGHPVDFIGYGGAVNM